MSMVRDALPTEDRPDRTALVLAITPGAAAAVAEAAARGGARVVAALDGDEAARVAEFGHLTLIVADVSDGSEEQASALVDAVVAAAATTQAIVGFDAAQIDLIGGALLGTSAVLLCAPSAAEWTTAVAVAIAVPPGGALHDRSRDAYDERLRRLNAEVARIAETLARLTGEDPAAPRGNVSDRSLGYRGPPVAAAGTTAASAPVRGMIRARRMRDPYLGEGLFADPAWDMLLDLYAAALENAQVSVSSLCIAAAVPPTTALRWIQTMHAAGLFERHSDPFDKRRAYVALSAQARDAMQRYFAATAKAGLATL